MLLTDAWVAQATDSDEQAFRQAVHTVLVGISLAPTLPSEIVMKGGILLAIKYDGDRHTTDIDFSTTSQVTELTIDQILAELKQGLASAVEELNYSLDCRVQSHEMRPKDPSKSFQTLKVNVGYARKGAPQHARLLSKNASTVVAVELSFNEVIIAVDVVEVICDKEIQAYAIEDLVAEKFRAILQQPSRNRTRRQDTYDLFRLMQKFDVNSQALRGRVHQVLLEKAVARGIAAAKDSMRNDDIVSRCQAEYSSLADEIKSDLPDFEIAFNLVRSYYEALPWG